MVWVFASRFDPAVVLVSGGGGAAVFDRQPVGARAVAAVHDAARLLACAAADLPGNLSAQHDEREPGQLHVRGYADADWPGVWLSLHLRVLARAGAVVGGGDSACGLLGDVRDLSTAAGRFRLQHAGGNRRVDEGAGTVLSWLCGAL